mmetsp:Transcript_1901/g.4118  ORF Transcript_1901/g.4118 Transcript_1901/m.4118 type:complete len:159 (+) Transcript_1901:251-727(+)|eukprot:CAMPEP_0172303270 /NCGR_PEP_ID=MMETSP1058-20130122/4825_1 /TAXON_ID=83371 /ORGANISM="Detonula confervacea, Strain CCMP 353" /LENGTH=158 /DNA_ID=CAMNT_0013014015 /DNA_START=218 /DNA_END=694 /DNA_ORIENTATION=-
MRPTPEAMPSMAENDDAVFGLATKFPDDTTLPLSTYSSSESSDSSERSDCDNLREQRPVVRPRPRRSRVQSMTGCSIGAQDFFGMPSPGEVSTRRSSDGRMVSESLEDELGEKQVMGVDIEPKKLSLLGRARTEDERNLKAPPLPDNKVDARCQCAIM